MHLTIFLAFIVQILESRILDNELFTLTDLIIIIIAFIYKQIDRQDNPFFHSVRL